MPASSQERFQFEGSRIQKERDRDLIMSTKDLQQEILQANMPIADEHIQFLERWLTEHILTADGRLGSYLAQEM